MILLCSGGVGNFKERIYIFYYQGHFATPECILNQAELNILKNSIHKAEQDTQDIINNKRGN